MRTNVNDGWSHRRKVSPFQELAGADIGDWAAVVLPHDAVLTTARHESVEGGHTNGYFAGGAFQYRRTFAVPEADRGKRILLEFDGVHRDAMVYVNDALAGQHAFGYSRFAVRIDPYLRFGAENEVRVECRTHLDSRWYAGAGIYRDVHLITKEPLHIAHDGVRVTTPDIDDERAIVEVAATVENATGLTVTTVLNVAVLDAEGVKVATGRSPVTLLPGGSGVVRRRLYVERPRLWDVDEPNLYTMRLELSDGGAVRDSERITFGIRSLQLDPRRGLRINGREVKLRGACVHSDNGPLGTAAIGRAEERRVELLKAAGFNAIRSSHNPLSSAMLAACDRAGMLVMEETFDVWTSGKTDFDYAFDFPKWWELDVEALVAKDFNHPSVIFYSIGNEVPEAGNPFGAHWGRRLAEKVRSLDETRFVTNGINGFVAALDMVLDGMRERRAAAAEAAESGGGVNTMMSDFGAVMGAIQASPPVTARTEESFAVLDVAGMNYADSRYEPDREQFPDRIIVGTETWPTSISGNWALVKANPHVIGDFTWTGWDYLGETGLGVVGYRDENGAGGGSLSTGYPGLTAWCGDIDITGHRRPVSYYREIVFGLRAAPYIAVFRPEHHGRDVAVASPWAWSDAIASWTWEGHEGKPVRVEVYSDADEIELLLDGEVVGRSKADDDDRFRTTFEVTYRPGTLTAVAHTAAGISGDCTLTTAGGDLVLRADADRALLRADTADLAFVALTLTDEAGNLHNGRDRAVTVTVSGPAVLQALGSAEPVTEETFSAREHRTFDGRALAVVRPTGAGAITVTAEAPGCPPVNLDLTAR
ncbi:beta-galactosidase [Amycolatopsis sp. NBRC 101858]|uniref:glycoside hydrolase family 2 TIM barrel-domain containing protein n=1 Tax=Amycolatopsis sp. NBRC 101858 TaxID=3032200 RepID=UPI0024A4E5D0|nr:glycoside hydrolase family 2 TIM barrel-domain containing protein [Amycolatopsis sp. NBRC 101858]GLY38870.1 beta-galactosidase [Amycolatopsis sp. NBRC 101858]